MGNRYVYLFIRKDIPFVNQIIQLGHAAYEQALKLPEFKDKTPSNFVLFEVNSESELLDIEAKLHKKIAGEYTIFYEDHFPKGYTAIATKPYDYNDPKRQIFKNYLLYREIDPVIFTGV